MIILTVSMWLINILEAGFLILVLTEWICFMPSFGVWNMIKYFLKIKKKLKMAGDYDLYLFRLFCEEMLL